MRDELSGLTVVDRLETSYGTSISPIATSVIPVSATTASPDMATITVGDLLNLGGIKAYKYLQSQKIKQAEGQ